jgi:hypothetical protein
MAILNLIDQQITAGHFFPVPGDQCRRCDFRRICDSRIQAIYGRKSQDPLVAGFQRLEEFDERRVTRSANTFIDGA